MRLRCVIVDDSPAVLRAASELLEGQGIVVLGVAATGVQAVRLIDELEPDVVLVDIDLGPESGFDLARRLVDTPDIDVNCKAHDLDNLYVVDTSFFPSSSAVNPSLTAIANAAARRRPPARAARRPARWQAAIV